MYVAVEPSTFNFSGLNQKITYTVTFARLANSGSAAYSRGFLTWASDKESNFGESKFHVVKVLSKLSNAGGIYTIQVKLYVVIEE